MMPDKAPCTHRFLDPYQPEATGCLGHLADVLIDHALRTLIHLPSGLRKHAASRPSSTAYHFRIRQATRPARPSLAHASLPPSYRAADPPRKSVDDFGVSISSHRVSVEL